MGFNHARVSQAGIILVFDTAIFDEAHTLRNVTSNRPKVIDALAPRVKRALTGTPMSNEALDVSGILKWLWQRGVGESGEGSGLLNEILERYFDPNKAATTSSKYLQTSASSTPCQDFYIRQ